MFEISIIIPVYNESENLELLLGEIENNLQQTFNYEIILVDDCSKDKTREIVNKIKLKNKIVYIKNNKNYGQSYSINKGILNSKFNTVVTIDGDGQNNPKDIITLANYYFKNNEISLVGGIRNKRKDSFIKIISSRIANYVRSLIFQDKCKDTGCSLKVFSKDCYLNFPFFNSIHRFLPALFVGFGFKTKFINVDHRARLKGYSKYGTLDRLYRGILDIIIVRNIINKYKNNKND